MCGNYTLPAPTAPQLLYSRTKAFDGCSFRFPVAEESDNVSRNAFLQEPPIRIAPYPNPYLFNQAKSDISFRNCIAWAKDSLVPIQLSDELPVYLNNVTPRRVPIHWSTRSIRISGGLAGEQTVFIRNTLRGDDITRPVNLPVVGVNSIKIANEANQSVYNGKLEILLNHEASLREGDRLFWFSRFDLGEGIYANPTSRAATQLYPVPMPIFLVSRVEDIDKTAIAEVPTDASGNQPRLPYRNEIFPLNVTATHTTEDDSLRKLEYLRKVIIMPNSDFRQPENSQYYVILNGSVQGKFEHGLTTVTDVTNIQLLQPGDFVNQDYVPSGTRIKAIDLAKASIELTQPVQIPSAVGNNSVVDNIPFCYVLST